MSSAPHHSCTQQCPMSNECVPQCLPQCMPVLANKTAHKEQQPSSLWGQSGEIQCGHDMLTFVSVLSMVVCRQDWEGWICANNISKWPADQNTQQTRLAPPMPGAAWLVPEHLGDAESSHEELDSAPPAAETPVCSLLVELIDTR